MNESSCCSTSSPAFGDVSVPDFDDSNRCTVASHYCFNLRFINSMLCGASFHMLICHLYISFGEMSVKVFGPFLFRFFVFLLSRFKISLYILDNSPLSDVSFVYIFTQSVACLLILLSSEGFIRLSKRC